jgi:hypothetical protein
VLCNANSAWRGAHSFSGLLSAEVRFVNSEPGTDLAGFETGPLGEFASGGAGDGFAGAPGRRRAVPPVVAGRFGVVGVDEKHAVMLVGQQYPGSKSRLVLTAA